VAASRRNFLSGEHLKSPSKLQLQEWFQAETCDSALVAILGLDPEGP